MNHIALYRLWRPQLFQDVVGQDHITQTLQNSLKSGRISHAYLFSGPRGTGKTSAAKIFAKALNCELGPGVEPCNTCSQCKRITEGSVMDVQEIDAASNRGVDEIRDIRDKVKYAPTEVRYKVYIIDEVHMLTTEAFNALLKTLEEPPSQVIFILATTEPNRLPATIISRCQRFDFHRVPIEDQISRLQHICKQEGLTAEIDALQYIARCSDGGMRDALSLLDQIVSFSGNDITYSQVIAVTGGIDTDQFKALAEAIKNQNIGKALEQIDDFMEVGKSVDKCMDSLIQYFRDLLMIKLVPDAGQMTERILDTSHFADLALQYNQDHIFRMIEILNHYHVEMKYASQPQTLFEIAVMKLCSLPTVEVSSVDVETIQHLSIQVTKLERELHQLKQSMTGINTNQAAATHSTKSASIPSQLEQSIKSAQPASPSPATKQSIDSAQPISQTTQQSIDSAQPISQATQQSIDSGQPISQTTQQSIDSAQPISQTTQQSIDSAQPASQTTQQSIDSAQPASQTTQPVTRKSASDQNSLPLSLSRTQSVPMTTAKAAAKWEPFLKGREGEAYQQLCSKWSQVLHQVKETKITVHAWLVDGEPAAVTDHQVLIAFKNEIHRKTTEKPANKQLIEQIIHQIYGKPISIVPLMQKEWNDIISSELGTTEAPAEDFKLEPELEPGKHKEEWINEAIDLFGEDLVVIKEE